METELSNLIFPERAERRIVSMDYFSKQAVKLIVKYTGEAHIVQLCALPYN
jgi:hypothetical protein